MATTKGKGGEFESKRNPFLNGPKRMASAPEFTEVPDICKSLDILLKAGCAALIGQTRDGGAVVLTILDGDKRHRTYCSTSEELQDAVDAMRDMYSD